MGRTIPDVEEDVAPTCPRRKAVDIYMGRSKIYPGAVTPQFIQHQPLLHATSRTLNRLGVPRSVKSGEPFTADRSPRMNVVFGRGGLREAPFCAFGDDAILVDSTHADPQLHIHLNGGRLHRT